MNRIMLYTVHQNQFIWCSPFGIKCENYKQQDKKKLYLNKLKMNYLENEKRNTNERFANQI